MPQSYSGDLRERVICPSLWDDTIDLLFNDVVMPAVDAVGRAAWEAVFDAIYILDDFSLVGTRRC